MLFGIAKFTIRLGIRKWLYWILKFDLWGKADAVTGLRASRAVTNSVTVQRVPRLLKVNNDKQRKNRLNNAFVSNGVVELFGSVSFPRLPV
jgi:hypothetical protein